MNNNDNTVMANTTDTNIDLLFNKITASTNNHQHEVNINEVPSTSTRSKQTSLTFRNENGLLVEELNDNMFNTNVLISKDEEQVSLNTSKYQY